MILSTELKPTDNIIPGYRASQVLQVKSYQSYQLTMQKFQKTSTI